MMELKATEKQRYLCSWLKKMKRWNRKSMKWRVPTMFSWLLFAVWVQIGKNFCAIRLPRYEPVCGAINLLADREWPTTILPQGTQRHDSSRINGEAAISSARPACQMMEHVIIPPLTLHAIEPTTNGLSAVTNTLDGLGIDSLQSVRLVFSSLTPMSATMKTWAPLNVEVRQIHVRQILYHYTYIHTYIFI